MERQRIGLIAAMPEEIRPLLKEVRHIAKSVIDDFPVYAFSAGDNDCRLIQSGIGMMKAEMATKALIGSSKPDLLISFGLGGAVKPGLTVGDVAIAGKTFLYDEKSVTALNGITLSTFSGLHQNLETICKGRGCKIVVADLVTSDTILNKKELSKRLPREMPNPIVDMETWAVAQVAEREGIPLLAVRSISDPADEELGFILDQFMDQKMNIRLWRVLRAILRKPWIIPQLLRLSRNSKIAARNLSAAVNEILKTVQPKQPQA